MRLGTDKAVESGSRAVLHLTAGSIFNRFYRRSHICGARENVFMITSKIFFTIPHFPQNQTHTTKIKRCQMKMTERYWKSISMKL